jgi:uncharacterized protein YyaL (SSP411 family)
MNRAGGNESIRNLLLVDRSRLPPDGGQDYNRLIFAASPYLLQHAGNPVDWFPWGEEAFSKAKRENKPVFLSIGYATCHWCHVMARESFEDPEVAAVLNWYFVPVKVDREERPDIDERYMTVSRLMTGSGGWPLNVFMTPDKRPFLTVTYIPKKARMGMPGIIELLENIAKLWEMQPDRVEKNCADVMASLRQASAPASGKPPGTDVPDAAFHQLEAMYDPERGGFGTAPKFPMPTNLSFLLRFWKKRGDSRPLAMVVQTLRMMRRGGIWDQTGSGCHRYSVDRRWLVPHFEKMLYDQALLASVYIDAFRAAGDIFFRKTAEEIFTFVLREMTAPEGGFYSALDADSEGEEGKYYVWHPAEIRNILGERDGEIFCRLFGVTPGGNFEGATILNLSEPPEDFAAREGIAPALFAADLERWRKMLLAEREKRVRPFRDEKILASWNGLMIAALAEGHAVTGNLRYRLAAERAVAFVKQRLMRSDGRLMRSFHSGMVSVPGFLDDYAFFVQGLLALYGATLHTEHLEGAIRLNRAMLRLFRDEASGGLFDTGSDAEVVLVRSLDASDNVMPSANAVAAGNLVRLGRLTNDQSLIDAGEAILQAFMGQAARQPAGYLQLLTELEELRNPVMEVTLIGRRDSPETIAMLHAIDRRFLPNRLLLFEEAASQTTEVRICAAGVCRQPVTSVGELTKLLNELA